MNSTESAQEQQVTLHRQPGGETRKRKRRPQFDALNDNEPESATMATLKSGSVYRLSQIDDGANPMSNATAPTLRKRNPPAVRVPLAVLEEEQKKTYNKEQSNNVNNKAYRRPYSQVKKNQESTTLSAVSSNNNNKSPADLKNILKNSGGLSLSEILQQKNLSLDDLLKGKQNALLALQTTATVPMSMLKTDEDVNNENDMQMVSRIPAAYLGLQTNENDQGSSVKKIKFPTLQRLKLFSGLSRGAQSNLNITSRRVNAITIIPTTATTTTIATTLTTGKRLPLDKKRQQLRSTLKPLALFKATSIATTTASTTTRITTTTIPLTTANTNDTNKINAFDDKITSVTTMEAITTESPMKQNVPEEQKMKSSKTSAMTTAVNQILLQTTNNIKNRSNIHYRQRTTHSNNFSNREQANIQHNSNNLDEEDDENMHLQVDDDVNAADTDQNEDEIMNKINQSIHFAAAANNKQQANANEKTKEEINYSDDLENFFEELVEKKNKNSNQNKHQHVEQVQKADIYAAHNNHLKQAFIDDVDDRTDLLELIEDRRSGNRLFKVLEQRNMTLEELIEHRKRGSSQLHLATIVENDHSSYFPGQKVVLHDNMDIVTAFENFPHFNLMNLKSVKPDDIKTDSQGSSYFTSIIDIEPTDNEAIIENQNLATENKHIQEQKQQRTEKSLFLYPSWKILALASLASTANRDTNRISYFLTSPKLLLENTSFHEVYDGSVSTVELDSSYNNSTQLDDVYGLINLPTAANNDQANVINTIENQVAHAHDLLDLELSGHGFKRSPNAVAASVSHQRLSTFYANMPAGIRSAVVASTAIVITSLATFVVTFVICRWKQIYRRKRNYTKTYNVMTSKLPNLTNTSSRRSSLRENIEEIVANTNDIDVAHGLATVSNTTPSHQLRNQNTLLFSVRQNHQCGNKYNCMGLETANTSTSNATTSTTSMVVTSTTFCGTNANRSASTTLCSSGDSTTSVALSLRNAHNVPATKLNNMDSNFPEVREYLFETLQKSF